MSQKIAKLQHAKKGYDRLDPGNTIITRKRYINKFLISRTIVSLVTTIMFIYALYTVVTDSNNTTNWYWFWVLGYSAIVLMYLYYTYDKVRDIFRYRNVKDNKYISSIDNDEHMFIYGKYVGRLSDFAVRRDIDLFE